MPTTLPDRAARTRHQRGLLLAELAAIAVAMLYVVLLAWNMAALEANLRMFPGPEQRLGDYNPMEPVHTTTGGLIARR
jgi:hypothetical protein